MIFHVVPLDDWLRDPERPYAPMSLAEDGFVHCSPDETTALAIADEHYRDAVGPLMVLLIDEEALDGPVRWEPGGGASPVLFPHVYGRINRTAVAGMLEIERGADGHATGLTLWS